MRPSQDNTAIFARIENLWADAEASTPEADGNTPRQGEAPVETQARIMARINRLMDEAEEMPLTTDAPGTAADMPADMPSIDDLASMVMAAEAHAPRPQPQNQPQTQHDDFDDVKERFENVSRLRPPHTDNRNLDNPDYAFGVAFSNLVRQAVRDYIESDFEPALREAIQSEMKRHLDSIKDGSANKDGIDNKTDAANNGPVDGTKDK